MKPLLTLLSTLFLLSCQNLKEKKHTTTIDELPQAIKEKLLGTWKSNKGLSEDFNEKYSNLHEKEKKFFSQIFGKLEITYLSNGSCKSSMPEHSIETTNDTLTLPKDEKTYSPTILGYTEEKIVFESTDEDLGKSILTINFQDDKTYWVYIGENKFSGIHAREYFSKQN